MAKKVKEKVTEKVKEKDTLQEMVETFISELGIPVTVKVENKEDENLVDIQLESEEAAILIGFHGETLQAIQLFLSFLIHKNTDKWVKIALNVGDYRQKREDQLRKLALNLAMKVKFSQEAQAIPNLSSLERRFVHMVLTDNPDVYTQSEGEGRLRQLLIKPKGTV